MNQTQATVGIGGSALTAALTTALTGTFGLDAAHAAAYAFIILFILGAVYSLASWFVSWKWPSVPPLPNLSASGSILFGVESSRETNPLFAPGCTCYQQLGFITV